MILLDVQGEEKSERGRQPLLSPTLKNVAFRRKALFVEGVSEFVKVAGMKSYYPRPEDPSCGLTCP